MTMRLDGEITEKEFATYDHIIVAFSGGKDSVACVLDLLQKGADPAKMELWHHDIDGRESDRFMDWAVTTAYCEAFAAAFGIPIYFSWKVGGFSREMLREDSLTAPIKFETPSGLMQSGGIQGKHSTRRKFPQVSADLSVRWCSAYLKVDVCSMALRNDSRFAGKRTLLVSGERAEESPGRAKYSVFEPDRADNRNGKKVQRHVDRYRPIHKWVEQDVWNIIETHSVRVHPAYYIGWGRVSCAACIFGSKDQWASLNVIDPVQVAKVAKLEETFGVTINRKESVRELIAKGTPYEMKDTVAIADAMSAEYTHDIFMTGWTLPAGAFGESCGPT